MNTNNILAYTVGALLYSPATNNKIATTILQEKIKEFYSLSLCLEDSISDNAVALAEYQIIDTFREIYEGLSTKLIQKNKIPKIFIRVRNPQQMLRVYNMIEDYQELLTGFIFPKYSIYCADEYSRNIEKINRISKNRIYMMPIIESDDIIDLNTRYYTLDTLKNQLCSMSDYVLNIRVGGNDFCKYYGIRRSCHETIYEILAVSHILSDIVTTFSKDFVISGPVFEYFAGEDHTWKLGLERELKHDFLNGFVGKTVIHPNQIAVVNESLRVSQKDADDAVQILEFQNNMVQVVKNESGERMNEIKTHLKWARKISTLAGIYGVK